MGWESPSVSRSFGPGGRRPRVRHGVEWSEGFRILESGVWKVKSGASLGLQGPNGGDSDSSGSIVTHQGNPV